jgi:formylglycine-generating enzyme required for sulfatase activity
MTWPDANTFCERLSALADEERAGRAYRLPTEAEWEHACRGGACFYQPFHFGDALPAALANYNHHYPSGWAGSGPYPEAGPCPVASYPANAFGLYDMHGNVQEWCADYHGPAPGTDRASRGGSWYNPLWHCRSASRCRAEPQVYGDYVGFRTVLEWAPPARKQPGRSRR